MRLLKTVAGLQAYIADNRCGRSLGLVPTMGALHEGHQSLIRRAIEEQDCVVVSIFVNPLQFAPTEDLDYYPRQLEADCNICRELGVDVVFAPSVQEMGIGKEITQVTPPPSLSKALCGAFRPGHFEGVATIVLRLIDLAQPTSAYFGEKDAQQLAVIRRLVTDLAVPVSIRACPTIREPSGLAISSRNQYLNESEKDLAPLLYAALDRARLSFHRGDRDRHTLLCAVKDALLPFPAIRVQYIDLVHPDSLHPLERIEDRGLLAIAAFVGTSRLIDNIVLSDRQPIIAIDGPAGAGKSTVTRQVADRLGLLYLDTGAMYRAITWLAMESGIDLDDAPAIAELLSQATLDLIPRPLPEKPTVTINGRDVTDAIRTPAVTERVSQVSAQPIVRRLLVERQKAYGQKGGVIAEGRDIGTNVFPDAELKVFLTASVQERAKRRWQEFQSQGHAQITLAQLEREIAERDRLDSQRTVAPLQKALDAIEIDSDSLSIEAVIDKIVDLYRTQFLALSFPSQVDCT